MITHEGKNPRRQFKMSGQYFYAERDLESGQYSYFYDEPPYPELLLDEASKKKLDSHMTNFFSLRGKYQVEIKSKNTPVGENDDAEKDYITTDFK